MTPLDDQQCIPDLAERYDVVVCGAGLAGLTLARQLKLAQPERSIALIERQAGPLPAATHKVGESTVELGAHYLGTKLQLADYLDRRHLPKLGLRYFFGAGTEPFHRRPEIGLSQFPPVRSYQFDRGVLENDLRQMNEALGITLIEGRSVQEIRLGEDDACHEVRFQDRKRTEIHAVQARWVVDAMGRRRYLQRQLGLTKGARGACSAVWFRVAGRVDVDAFSPASAREWHRRVVDGSRYLSTNHLMGTGYWVWLIPLGSEITSVGIVTDERIHPFEAYHNYDNAMAWLHTNEPVLAERLHSQTVLDFSCMRHYSHSSSQLFSQRRWACVGDAGVFADPHYSPGIDLIGFANTMVTELIRRDFQGKLTQEIVDHYNQYLINLNDSLTRSTQSGYPLFGNGTVTAAKLLWDFTTAWSFNCPHMFNDIYLDPEKLKQLRQITAGFYPLARRMQHLFAAWAARSNQRLTYDFFDYLRLGFLSQLRLRNLQSGKSFDELKSDQAENMARIEELAQVLFLLAVEDVMPERLSEFPEPLWLNVWRIDLDPENWHMGLFQPKTRVRDFSAMRHAVRSQFRTRELMTA